MSYMPSTELMSIPEIVKVIGQLRFAALEKNGLSGRLDADVDAAVRELSRPPNREEVAGLAAAFSNNDRVCRRIEQNFDGAGEYIGPPNHNLN